MNRSHSPVIGLNHSVFGGRELKGSADRGGAHGPNSSTLSFGLINQFCGGGGEFHPFPVNPVFADIAGPHRGKGAVTDVQDNTCDPHSFGANLCK